ncbi:MAG: hypothetical protein MZV65_12875 [Chromatiales bacterium]|nr:hypothetical protein [Chromatiales bacterium]
MMGIGGFTPLDRLHDPGRLAGRVRRHEDGQRPVLADPDHPLHRQGHRRPHQGRRRTSPWSTARPARSWPP